MAKKNIPQVIFGGVSSRDNPLSMPRERSLRCCNWRPMPDGHTELREGYQQVADSGENTPIHSLISYRNQTGHPYLVFWQGTTPKLMDLVNNVVTAPPVKGKAVTSSHRFQYYWANNRLHAVNGTDYKWFDGTCWRDIGLRELTSAEVLNVVVSAGLRELTADENAAVTFSTGGTGTFPQSPKGGRLFYCALFDPTTNELGPATVPVGSGRFLVSADDLEVTLSSLPDLHVDMPDVRKVFGMTEEDGSFAFAVNDVNPVVVISAARVGRVVTVQATGHGLSAGDLVAMEGMSEGAYNHIAAVVSVPDANHYTFNFNYGGSSTGGSVTHLYTVDAATTSVTFHGPSFLNSPVAIVNEQRGLAASSVGGAQPGYQFYASIWMRDGGDHVGNRVAIGARLKNEHRCVVHIDLLPDLTSENPEYDLLIGRTGDGAEVPYVLTDSSANWQYAGSGQTSILIDGATIDGAKEIPVDNTAPPEKLYACTRVADRIYAIVSDLPYIYRSESEADVASGDYVGRPEQSFPGTSETFPTAEPVSAVAEFNADCLCGSLHDAAILSDPMGSGMGWQGPWNTGIAGPNAITKGFNGMPYWLNGAKQLCSVGSSGPYAVSDEYEAGLLGQIADEHLGEVEIVYERIPVKRIDRLRIHFIGKDGLHHHVFHDFKLMDATPGPSGAYSPLGQGYEAIYGGPLGSAHTIAAIRDRNDVARTYVGASNGKIYVLDEGASDAGAEFDAEQISFLSFGENRPLVGPFEYHGDDNVEWSLCTDVTTADFQQFTNFERLNRQAYPTDENDHHWLMSTNAPEMPHAFLRLTLRSHSVDAPNGMALNDPPHCPVEIYGRILATSVELSDPRG